MHFATASGAWSLEEEDHVEDVGVLDLLECPLCMEPLEVTAKVLPCQHTFCKPCLLRLESSSPSRLPICCPECRAPLSGRVEDLPTNLLLARLIQGLQRERLTTPRNRGGVCVSSTAQDGSVVEVLQPVHSSKIFAIVLAAFFIFLMLRSSLVSTVDLCLTLPPA
uniref:RING-type domain-containing protein n=1 Tax=Astyanax mexicanus TaxID=7994 RepID=A0A8B9K8N9_ASTMX